MGIIIDIIIYLVLGAMLSWYFYYFKRKDLFGGFIGGAIVGLFGAILGNFLSDYANFIIEKLQRGFNNVNIITGLLGGFLALYLFNKINHDRIRKDF